MNTFTEHGEAFFRRRKAPQPQPANNDNKESYDTDSGISSSGSSRHQLAGLQCDKYGGPSQEAAQEMVYWEDIPADNKHVSPFQKTDQVQYLSFEPDAGGW